MNVVEKNRAVRAVDGRADVFHHAVPGFLRKNVAVDTHKGRSLTSTLGMDIAGNILFSGSRIPIDENGKRGYGNFFRLVVNTVCC